MSVLNHKEDVHFCTREWVSLSHYWRASAKYGRDSPTMGETRQLWARLAIIGEATHQLPNVTR